MGLGRVIRNAILFPLIILTFLLAHTYYQLVYVEPKPIDVGLPPKTSVINGRQPIFRALQTSKTMGEIVKYTTSDVVLETPLFRIEGSDNLAKLIKKVKTKFSYIAKYNGEYHGAIQAVLDVSFDVKGLQYLPISIIPSRVHFYFEPKDGGVEKIFRIEDKWYGTNFLNEKTTVGFWGKLQSSFRTFMGQTLLTLISKGWI